uniref:Uncharacterized protein n=1 Tax=Vespula pensylvanica TaxID=30213 RepID=A0A834NZP3_VESPE|nr:hypothetical protein H0235_008428 [Vespula pensylvanica]
MITETNGTLELFQLTLSTKCPIIIYAAAVEKRKKKEKEKKKGYYNGLDFNLIFSNDLIAPTIAEFNSNRRIEVSRGRSVFVNPVKDTTVEDGRFNRRELEI